MHVCENNCALTLEDEIKFWGLDDALLQVAAVFIIHTLCFLCLSACVCLIVLCLGSSFGVCTILFYIQVTATFVIHCVFSVHLFEIKFWGFGRHSCTVNGTLWKMQYVMSPPFVCCWLFHSCNYFKTQAILFSLAAWSSTTRKLSQPKRTKKLR